MGDYIRKRYRSILNVSQMLDHLHNKQAEPYLDRIVPLYDFCFKNLIRNDETAKSDFLKLAEYIKKLETHKQFKTFGDIAMISAGAVATYAICNQITDIEILKLLFASFGGTLAHYATQYANHLNNYIQYYCTGKSHIHCSLIEATKYHSNVPKMFQEQIDNFNQSEYSSYLCGIAIAAAALDDEYVSSLMSSEKTL